MDNGEWTMDNGEWTMGNGQWGMDNGEWTMENGQWGMDNGEWTMGNASPSEALEKSGALVEPYPEGFIFIYQSQWAQMPYIDRS